MVSEQEVTKENEDRLKKIYYIAVKTRNFEITQLVQRNNFFMIFQGVLLASIIYSSNTVPYVQLMICIAGCYIAVQQTKAAAGAKFWQEYWEAEVVKAEKNLESFYESKSIEPAIFYSSSFVIVGTDNNNAATFVLTPVAFTTAFNNF